MSQEINYTEIKTVNTADNYQREFAPIISQILNAAPAEISAGVKKCCGVCHPKSTQLLSPTEMKIIQVDYDKHLQAVQKQNRVDIEQLKVAALATLVTSQENLLVSDPVLVAKKIQHVVDATTVAGTRQAIKTAIHEIKVQHTESFVANVVKAVEQSAISVGFKEVKVQKPSPQMVRVVAVNNSGQNLIAEIENDKQVDIRTELIGFVDGSCNKVMRAFDDEMMARGITTSHKEKKQTHGIPQMPFARKLTKAKKTMRGTFEDENAGNQEKNNELTTIKC